MRNGDTPSKPDTHALTTRGRGGAIGGRLTWGNEGDHHFGRVAIAARARICASRGGVRDGADEQVEALACSVADLIAVSRCAGTISTMDPINLLTDPPVRPAIPRTGPPRCPMCGSTALLNVQEIQERREYPVQLSESGTDIKYGVAHIAWTTYELNSLQCIDCRWETDMDSAGAEDVLP